MVKHLNTAHRSREGRCTSEALVIADHDSELKMSFDKNKINTNFANVLQFSEYILVSNYCQIFGRLKFKHRKSHRPLHCTCTPLEQCFQCSMFYVPRSVSSKLY